MKVTKRQIRKIVEAIVSESLRSAGNISTRPLGSDARDWLDDWRFNRRSIGRREDFDTGSGLYFPIRKSDRPQDYSAFGTRPAIKCTSATLR